MYIAKVILTSLVMSFILAVGSCLVVWIVVGIILIPLEIFDMSHPDILYAYGIMMVLSLAGGAIFGFLSPILKYQNDKKAKIRKESNALRRIENELYDIRNTSQKLISKLPRTILSAELHLNKAEKEFEDGLYSPFWEQVEKATIDLVNYQNVIEELNSHTVRYRNLAVELPDPSQAPSFPPVKITDISSVLNRLNAIFRKAQKDPSYANIYEQRKQSKILVDGFSSLSNAIYEIGDRIVNSIDNLSDNVSSYSDKLSDISSEQIRLSKMQHRKQKLDSTLRQQHEDKVIREQNRQTKILGDIQRKV